MENEFTLARIGHAKDSTLGAFGQKDSKGILNMLCFALEDEKRDVKVMHETRIPAGKYELKLRTYGKWFEKFKPKFPEGIFEIMNVPNYTDVLIHTGNTDDDSSGCVLVGNTAMRAASGEFTIGESVLAYERVYPIMLAQLKKSGKIFLNVLDTI